MFRQFELLSESRSTVYYKGVGESKETVVYRGYNTCANWVETLQELDIRISMDGKGRATDNAIIERWFRTLKQKYIYLNPPETGLTLFHGVRTFVDKYNQRRHQGINRKKPMELYHRAA